MKWVLSWSQNETDTYHKKKKKKQWLGIFKKIKKGGPKVLAKMISSWGWAAGWTWGQAVRLCGTRSHVSHRITEEGYSSPGREGPGAKSCRLRPQLSMRGATLGGSQTKNPRSGYSSFWGNSGLFFERGFIPSVNITSSRQKKFKYREECEHLL